MNKMVKKVFKPVGIVNEMLIESKNDEVADRAWMM